MGMGSWQGAQHVQGSRAQGSSGPYFWPYLFEYLMGLAGLQLLVQTNTAERGWLGPMRQLGWS